MMENNEYIDLFKEAIIKGEDGALVYDIEVDEFESYKDEIETGVLEEVIYGIFSYQVDDRLHQMDTEVEDKIKEALNGEWDVSTSRQDAYPNGYAYYKTTISKNY